MNLRYSTSTVAQNMGTVVENEELKNAFILPSYTSNLKKLKWSEYTEYNRLLKNYKKSFKHV